jgi:hypothetical protein
MISSIMIMIDSGLATPHEQEQMNFGGFELYVKTSTEQQLLAYSLPGGNCNNGDAVCDVIHEAAGILKDASCLWTLWLQRRPKRSFREPHSRS